MTRAGVAQVTHLIQLNLIESVTITFGCGHGGATFCWMKAKWPHQSENPHR